MQLGREYPIRTDIGGICSREKCSDCYVFSSIILLSN